MEQGIDSLSLIPDSAISTMIEVYKKEKQLKRRRGVLGLFTFNLISYLL